MSEEESNGISFEGTLDEFREAILNQSDVDDGKAYVEEEELEVFNLDKGEGNLTFYLLRDGSAYETVLRFDGDSNSIPDEIIKSIEQEVIKEEKENDNEEVKVTIEDLDGVEEYEILDEWLEEQASNGACIESEYANIESSFFKHGEDGDEQQVYSVEKSLKDEISCFEIIEYGEADIKITLSLPQDLKDDETIDFSKLERKELEHVGPFGDGTCDYKYSMSPKAIENIQARVLNAINNYSNL